MSLYCRPLGKKSMHLSCFFLVISAFSLPVISSQTQCKAVQHPTSWDSLVLTLQWPPSFCIEHQEDSARSPCHIPAYVTTWTIHGLWPQTTPSSQYTDCFPQQTFDYAEIKDLENVLNRTWPDLIDKRFTVLWQNEWCKHGSCAQDYTELKGEAKYFRKAIDLHKNFDVDMALKSASIVPGYDYRLSDITKAIYDTFKVNPSVHCSTVKNKVYLEEIRLCFYKNFTLKNCYENKTFEYTSLYPCSATKPLRYPRMYHTKPSTTKIVNN